VAIAECPLDLGGDVAGGDQVEHGDGLRALGLKHRWGFAVAAV
jgi:hypothetical protein